MQFPDPASSQSWAEKVAWALGGGTVLTFILGAIRLILQRNKPRTEIAKLEAEAEHLRIGASVQLSTELRRLHSVIGLMEATMDSRQQSHLDEIKYYREELKKVEAERDLLQLQLDHQIRIGKG